MVLQFRASPRAINASFCRKIQLHTENICLVSSGWAGLTASLSVLKNRNSIYNKSSCLIPNHTFTATTSAALTAGLKPKFINVEPNSWQMSQEAVLRLERKDGAKTFAVPVSPFGGTVDCKFWAEMKEQNEVETVVDAAWCFDYNQIAELPSIISLHATKSFGIGEGGIVISRDTDFIAQIKKCSNFGLSKSGVTEIPGFNFKLSEYSCAVALANLDKWPEKRRKILQVRQKI